MDPCTLCPRNCSVDRTKTFGFCRLGSQPIVAKSMLHLWEEPCICYNCGSGAVFFSGCQLQCLFCQNHEISAEIKGKPMTSDSLADLFLSLQSRGACNINLVSPTPHLNSVIPALKKARGAGLRIPVVFNSSGYENIETLKRLDGLVDIYLPDFKYFSPELSKKLSFAQNYFKIATSAIFEMYRQTGPVVWNENNQLKSGLLIRHLILPGNTKDSINILNHLAEILPKDGFVLSVMSQYTPMYKAKEIPPFDRKITKLEYQKVIKHIEKLEFEYVYTQSKESASTDFVPYF